MFVNFICYKSGEQSIASDSVAVCHWSLEMESVRVDAAPEKAVAHAG